VSKALEKLPKPTYPAARNGDPLIVHLAKLRPDIEAAATGSGTPIGDVKFLSPVAAPSRSSARQPTTRITSRKPTSSAMCSR